MRWRRSCRADSARDILEQRAVDQVDDLQVTRQQPLEKRDRPGLERFGQQRVVRVRENPPRHVPGLFPFELVLVEQQAHSSGMASAGCVSFSWIAIASAATRACGPR
jgi:hypothetical protein